MQLSSMISQLQEMKDKLGDVEVLISDGWAARYYRGNFRISRWDDGLPFVDIGIGGCLEYQAAEAD